MNARTLRRIFEAALGTSLLTPLVLTGCGHDLEGYESPVCEGRVPSVSGLAPAVIPDVVQLRRFMPGQEGTVLVSASGTACATATDPQACLSALEALSPGERFGRDCPNCGDAFFLATSQGDQVQAISTLAGVRDFLGAIDTPQEAVLLAFASGLTISCDKRELGAVRARPEGGFDVIGFSEASCGMTGGSAHRDFFKVSSSGELVKTDSDNVAVGPPYCVGGRRPAGLETSRPGGAACALGRHFAETARMEAASVPAFLMLRDELRAHGAPLRLQRAAMTSALEEVQHARVTRSMALRHGAVPLPPKVARTTSRPLFAMALENRVEGCIRETWGALLAHHQSLHARDPHIRSMMRGIAADETRHAALSWEVDRWACSRVGRTDRNGLREAGMRAVRQLRAEASAPIDSELIVEAGMPQPQQAVDLVDKLERELWRQA